MLKSATILSCAVVAGMLFTGCVSNRQPNFIVNVNSIASPLAQERKTFAIVPGNEGVTANDLQFNEYAEFLTRALSMRGFTIATNANDVDCLVQLAYGISAPENRQETYAVPIIGQTGISSARTTGTAVSFGSASRYGSAASYGGQTYYSGSTQYTPSYGVTGMYAGVRNYTVFHSQIRIAAFDLKAAKNENSDGVPPQLWVTTLSSTGFSGDLRRAAPVMIAASISFLGRNSGQSVPILLREHYAVVKAVRGQLGQDAENFFIRKLNEDTSKKDQNKTRDKK
jgi:hypothetical protein